MIIISSLLLSAFFSCMQIAFVSSNRLNLEIEKNHSGLIPKLLSIITQYPSRFIATMLIGNNFVLVIYGIFMGQFILDNLAFIELTSINELTLVLIQTLISTLVILITAEFIPKVLFQIYSNISMKIFAIPAYFFYTILYSITSIVTIISNFILKSFFKVNLDDSGISFSKFELVNYIAPEHLELSIDDPEHMLPRIRNAGAIFMGRFTSESVGDYCAGPSHVLPTSSTARFSSPLGVYDFQKRSSVVMCNENSASKLGKTASVIARGESLTAHARSAEYRIKN